MNMSKHLYHLLISLCVVFVSSHFATAQSATLPDNQIRAIAWSPDASHIAIGYQNGQIEIIPLDSPSDVQVLQPATEMSYILALDWSPDGQMLASGSAGYMDVLTVWDVATGTSILTDNRFWDDLLSVTWSPDGTQVLVTAAEPRNNGSSSGLVNIASGRIQELSVGTASSVQWSSDNTKIGVSHVSNIYVLDTNSLKIIAEYPIEQTKHRTNLQNQPIKAIWNPDGKRLAVGMGDGRVFILSNENPNKLELVTTLIAHDYNGNDRLLGFVYALSFTNNGNRLTSISGDGTVRTWDTSTWQVIDEVTTAPNYGAVFTVYGGRAAVPTTLDAMQASPDIDNAFTQSSIANGQVQIIVPDPSLDRLNAIAELCVRDAATQSRAVTGLTSQRVTSLDALPDFVAQVEALPEGAIPAACRADLLAVADALR